MPFTHTPVLLKETLEILALKPGETVCDVTLGLGGHAVAFLNEIGPSGKVIGIETDAENMEQAKSRLQEYPNVEFYAGNFRFITDVLPEPVDVLFADLGLSSPHVDDGSRGMSFRFDAPLDMRFNRNSGRTAAELIDQTPEQELRRIFAVYGEVERVAALVTLLKKRHPQTTNELNVCAEEIYKWRNKEVLPQIYQALRMAVNEEIGSLEALLAEIQPLITLGGRIAIMSYHSLEDRLVKQSFRDWCTDPVDPFTGQSLKKANWELLTKKPITPGDEEVAHNPRARSAKLRVVRRLS